MPSSTHHHPIAGETVEQVIVQAEDERQAYRAGRYALLAVLREASQLGSVKRCQTVIPGETPTMRAGRAGVAHTGGVTKCGSVWACPVCSPTIRRNRTADVDAVLAHHFSKIDLVGEETAALFVTVTIQHDREDALRSLLDILLGEFRKLQQSRNFRRLAASWNLAGFIKALEVTYGASGFHPHLHMVWLFDDALSPDGVVAIRDYLKEEWAARMAGLGLSSHMVHGVDVQPLHYQLNKEAKTDIAKYLVKVDGGWGAAMELLRADLKKGRHGRYSPPELLRRAVEYGEAWAWRAWWEYELAMKGRRMLTWSRGLRERAGLDVELSDEDAAKALEAPLGDDALEHEVHPRRWELMRQAGHLGAYLSRFEEACRLAYALCDVMGTGSAGWAARGPVPVAITHIDLVNAA